MSFLNEGSHCPLAVRSLLAVHDNIKQSGARGKWESTPWCMNKLLARKRRTCVGTRFSASATTACRQGGACGWSNEACRRRPLDTPASPLLRLFVCLQRILTPIQMCRQGRVPGFVDHPLSQSGLGDPLPDRLPQRRFNGLSVGVFQIVSGTEGQVSPEGISGESRQGNTGFD
jgi:hypothetical protein